MNQPLLNPFSLFESWIAEAQKAYGAEFDAMTLATASKEGRPSARIVLFKGLKDEKIFFYTNYESRKSAELITNPFAALVFYWPKLTKQIRIEGRIEQASREESEAYFRMRPRESQIGAWASRQSCFINGRADLEKSFSEMERKFQTGEVPCPPHWGGFRLIPEVFEFWEAGEFRLHDRRVFQRKEGKWEEGWLSP